MIHGMLLKDGTHDLAINTIIILIESWKHTELLHISQRIVSSFLITEISEECCELIL